MFARLTSTIIPKARVAQLSSQFQFRRTMATSIPKTMKGVLVEKTGGVEVLQYKTDLPVPAPKAGEVLVKNDFIGINYIDTYIPLQLFPPLSLADIMNTATSEPVSTRPRNLRSSAAKQKVQLSLPVQVASSTTSKSAIG